MFRVSVLLLGLLTSTVVKSAPVPAGCYDDVAFKEIQVSAPYDAEARMVSGNQCVSPCQIEAGGSYSVQTEVGWSVRNLLGSIRYWQALDRGNRGRLSMSWATVEGTSIITAQSCKWEGVTCSMMVSPKMVRTTGKARHLSKDAGGLVDAPEDEWHEFIVEAASEEPLKGGESEGLPRAVMNFDACLISCVDYENGCPDAFTAERCLKICPSDTAAPQPGEGHFGGTPGFISIEDAAKRV